MSDCIFCKTKKSEFNLWQNKAFYLMFDNAPVSPGHILIIPNSHIVEFNYLDLNDWNLLYPAIRSALEIVEKIDLKDVYAKMLIENENLKKKKFIMDCINILNKQEKPTGFNHGINDGRSAGRTVDHLHWHIIPRYKNDVIYPTGGVRGVIPEKADYK